METLQLDSAQTNLLICALKEKLPDPRDNRGKRHNLAFIICAVVIAIMAGRATTSRIFRLIRNRIDWLAQITGIVDATPISRAHLPRLLAQVMAGLRTLAMQVFRQAKIPNMMAALDNFCDSNKLLGEFLKRVGFL